MTFAPAPPEQPRTAAPSTGAADNPPPALRRLAEAAGVALDWTDEAGRPRAVGAATLQQVLTALGHACDAPDTATTSLRALEGARAEATLVTARVGERIVLPWPVPAGAADLGVRLTLESGAESPRVATVDAAGSCWSLDGIDTPGYHRLTLASADETRSIGVAVAPPKAYREGEGQVHGQRKDDRAGQGKGERRWGTAVQLHALRPASGSALPDVGFGDFGALAAFAAAAGAAGADALALSPTHAGFAADATGFSPYSPSSRLFHNVLFIDPRDLADAAAASAAAHRAGIEADAAALAAEPLIDWPRAAALKMRWLRALVDASAPAYASPLPEALRLHATFEALHAHFLGQGIADWREWPVPYRDAASADVAAFASAHADEIAFHARLQRLADAGLQRAQQAATDAGMAVGLICDLAIGMTAAGSHAWSSPADVLAGLEIGAPPDMLNAEGQRWGLTTFSPTALQRNGFEPFIATLRAAMRHGGGVRIDHILGLNRLWLVPRGASAACGAYVHYPLRDLVNLLILESHRHRAVVIGEDLGTVPPGFRETMADAGILGMSVLWLERPAGGTGFTPPADWSANSVAMTTTHDLPTVAGWWCGRDIDWRGRLGAEADVGAARARREVDRAALAALAALAATGDGDPAGIALTGDDAPGDPVTLAIDAVGAAPAPLLLIPVEDLLGLVEQPNFPGTTHEHPNWRRRLDEPADRLLDTPAAARRVARLRRLRPRPSTTAGSAGLPRG